MALRNSLIFCSPGVLKLGRLCLTAEEFALFDGYLKFRGSASINKYQEWKHFHREWKRLKVHGSSGDLVKAHRPYTIAQNLKHIFLMTHIRRIPLTERS